MPDMSPNRNGELPDFQVPGPFGGIQSELPPEMIERFGFLDSLNFMFRLGRARVRPAFNATIPAMPNPQEPWVGIYDFFTSAGNRIQVGVTPTRLLWLNTGVWTQVTGALTGGIGDKFTFAVVGQKLCFCQGIDKVKLWNGITAGFADASASAVPAKYLFEVDNHLIAANTLEGGLPAFQRVRWTGAGDPTDWVSFNAGQVDLFNDLGPITGGIKIYQSGYIFQQLGIVQVNITGIGTAPFTFTPLSSRSKGLIAPYSLAANGDTIAYYVGKDNIYSFDGTTATPIGDMPLEGRAKMGAKTRIFGDLVTVDINTVLGFVSTSIAGNPFNAYWLVIPNIAIWVFNADEVNWTRWSIDGTVTAINEYTDAHALRIMDLIGTIAQQLWHPVTLTANSAFDSVMVGKLDGGAVQFDFTGWSEKQASLVTGEMSYGDDRHESATKKVRIAYKDNGETAIDLTLTNEEGQTVTNNAANPSGIPLGTAGASGKTRQQVVPTNLPGAYVTIEIDCDPGSTFELSKLAPVYSPAGEVKTTS